MKRIKRLLVACLMSMVVVCFGAGVFDFTAAKADSLSATAYINTGANVTATAAGGLDGGLIGGVTRYMQDWGDGLKVSSSTTTGTIMSNAIDLSEIGDSVLLRFFPCDEAIISASVRIIDTSDDFNYILIDYTPNSSWVFTNSRGAMWLGVDTTITYKTSSGYNTTSSEYEYGQVMGWWWPYAWQQGIIDGRGIECDIGDGRGVMFHNPSSNSFERFSVAFNKDTNVLSTTRKARTLSDFVGFGGNTVYVQLSWTSSTSAADDDRYQSMGDNGSGFLIDMLAGCDFTNANLDGGSRISASHASIPEELSILSADNFVKAGPNVTVSAAGGLDGGLIGGVTRYMQDWGDGLKVSSSTTTGTIMSNAIDLSEIGDSVLLRFFPCDEAIISASVRIIDTSDDFNYILIDYTPNSSWVFTNSRGAMWLGVDTTITYKTSSGYNTTSSEYEYGQVMGWWWPYAWQQGIIDGRGIECDIGDGRGVMFHNPSSNSFERFSVAFNKDTNVLSTTRKARTLSDFVGFGGNTVYVQLSWTSSTSAADDDRYQSMGDNGSGFLIDMLAGCDFTYRYIASYPHLSAVKAASISDEYDLDNPEWSWTEGYSTATATFTGKTTGHTTVETAVIKDEITAATCTANGTKVYKATVNFHGRTYNDMKSETLLAFGHSYGDWVAEVPAEIGIAGTLGHYHCSVCGKDFDDKKTELNSTVIPALNGIRAASLSLNGDIGINLYVYLDGASSASGTFNGNVVTAVSAINIAGLPADIQFVKFTCKVAPKDYSTNVTFAVTDTDITAEYSVSQYIDNYLGSTTAHTNAYDLVQTLKIYCEAARAFFATNETPDPLDDLSEDAMQGLADYKLTVNKSELYDGDVVLKGATLVLETETAINIYFKTSSLDGKTFTVNGENVTPQAVASYEDHYVIKIADIAAKDLNSTYTIVVDGYTITYSALSYVYAVVVDGDYGVALMNVAKALYNYSVEADAYFGA